MVIMEAKEEHLLYLDQVYLQYHVLEEDQVEVVLQQEAMEDPAEALEEDIPVVQYQEDLKYQERVIQEEAIQEILSREVQVVVVPEHQDKMLQVEQHLQVVMEDLEHYFQLLYLL